MFSIPSFVAWLLYWAAITPLSKLWGQDLLNWYLSHCQYACTAEKGWDYSQAAFWFSFVVFSWLAMPAIAHFFIQLKRYQDEQSANSKK